MYVRPETQIPQDWIPSLFTYSYHVLSYAKPSISDDSTALPNGFVVDKQHSSLISLLSHLSYSELESICLNLLRLLSTQPAHTVVDQFIVGSLSQDRDIRCFSDGWLYNKITMYTSQDEIPENEQEAYNLTIDALQKLSCFPNQDDRKNPLCYSIRRVVYDLFSECYLDDKNKTILWQNIGKYAYDFFYIGAYLEFYIVCFQLLKAIIETWDVDFLSSTSLSIYRIDIWTIIERWKQIKLKNKPKYELLIRKCIEFEGLLVSIVEVWARRIPRMLIISLDQLKRCVEFLEEAIQMQGNRSPMIMEYYHCLCSLRRVYEYLSVDDQHNWLVCRNDGIQL